MSSERERSRWAKPCLEDNDHLNWVFLDAANQIGHVSPAAFDEYAQGVQSSPYTEEQAGYIKDLLNPDLRLQPDSIKTFDKQRLETNAAHLEVKKAVEDALAAARVKPIKGRP